MKKESQWSEDYELGIRIIDEQHKKLFSIMAEIASLDAGTSNKQELKKILGELNSYMHRHFEEEEAFMRQSRYPELENHQKLHSEIIKFVNATIANSPTIAMIQTKLKFIIKKMLIDHIVNEDTKYKLCLTNNGELSGSYDQELG